MVRGLPALLYRRFAGARRAVAAGLLQATTLTFVIVATQIGLVTGKITPTAAASLLAAGLLSAALFPAGAQRLLSRVLRPGKVTTVCELSLYLTSRPAEMSLHKRHLQLQSLPARPRYPGAGRVSLDWRAAAVHA